VKRGWVVFILIVLIAAAAWWWVRMRKAKPATSVGAIDVVKYFPTSGAVPGAAAGEGVDYTPMVTPVTGNLGVGIPVSDLGTPLFYL